MHVPLLGPALAARKVVEQSRSPATAVGRFAAGQDRDDRSGEHVRARTDRRGPAVVSRRRPGARTSRWAPRFFGTLRFGAAVLSAVTAQRANRQRKGGTYARVPLEEVVG